MKKFLIVLICVLLLGACQREDEGKDRRLVAAERMLEAIVEGNKRKMDHIYVDGAVPHPDDIFKLKKDWGMDKLTYEDFQLEEVSIHVFHANYKDTRTGEAKALAFRVKEDPKGGVLIDFVGVVESK